MVPLRPRVDNFPASRLLTQTSTYDPTTKQRLAAVLERKPEERRSGWDALKGEPGRPTVKHIYRFLQHLNWLRELAASGDPLAGIPPVKVQRFAAGAEALNAARIKEPMEPTRWALAAALLHRQLARA